MKRLRCFLAIDPDRRVRDRLAALRRELAATAADVRWVREEGVHCTVKFLGSVEAGQVEPIRQALSAALGHRPAFEARVRGVGFFGRPRSPRVVWAGMEDADASRGALGSLAAAVEAALEPHGFAPEAREFRPHLTLGRVRSPRAWEAAAAIIEAHAGEDFGTMQVAAVTLYRSEPQAGGSVYTPLSHFELAGR